MSYSYYMNMTSFEKEKLVDGNEISKLNEEYKRKNHHPPSPSNVILTPKRRYDETDNEIQEMDDEDFQMIERKQNWKKTRQLLNTDQCWATPTRSWS